MLFREIIIIYCASHMKYTNALCRQNVEILNIMADGWLHIATNHHMNLPYTISMYLQFVSLLPILILSPLPLPQTQNWAISVVLQL